MSAPCAFKDCRLPVHCTHCETCLPHCAGMSTWWQALKYFARVWWSLRGRQGGWIAPAWMTPPFVPPTPERGTRDGD